MLVLSLSEQFGDFQFVTTQHEIYNITRNAHAHILPRACQPMRKLTEAARARALLRSLTSYESARTAEVTLAFGD